MYSFKNDYSEGCHPRILEALAKSNLEQQEGYGDDVYSNNARKAIRESIGVDNADIYFVSGGTQANAIIISSMLKSFESVISANTGHINVHEAGAIEATGHRIESVFSEDGKLTVKHIEGILSSFEDHHMTRPGMVYISNSTEVGTVYTKEELEDLYKFCKSKGLYLFLDGARLGSALQGSDMTIKDIAELTDIFYIGGTKNGGLLGEAIVITNENLKADMLFYIKQRGALLAKGRLLGIQFYELFKDGLFFELAKHANDMASKLTKGLNEKDYDFLADSTSNQIFPILPNELIKKLSESYGFYVRKKTDSNHSAIRLVTSRATNKAMVDKFIQDLE